MALVTYTAHGGVRVSNQTPQHAQGRKYTQEQIEFLITARLKHAMEYREVARAFQEKFGGSRTAEQMRHAFRSYAHTAFVDSEGEVEQHPHSDFTHSSFAGIKRKAKTDRGRAFVTAAMPVSNLSQTAEKGGKAYGHNLYKPGFASVRTWQKHKKGELVILPMRAHMPALHGQPSYYDPELRRFEHCFANEFQFNDNLRALDVHLNPQQIYPLTGLHRIRGGKSYVIVDGKPIPTRFTQSLIFATPKQDKEPIATGNGTKARDLYGCGTICLPEYLPNRVGRIAEDGHVLGGLIVEWDDDKFWVRQVQFAADGSFCDIDGNRYNPDGTVEKVRAKALRMGDLHGGLEDHMVLDSQIRLAGVVQPEEVYAEDVFDGGSGSHHVEKLLFTRATRPNPFRALEDELAYDARLLDMLHGRFKSRLVIVASNHHDFLMKWIERAAYIKEPQNYILGHRIVVELADGRDPLRLRLDPKDRYEWLEEETDRYVEGVQMGAHGHLGVDGARGSPAELEKTFGSAMIGHLHYSRIVGKLFVVGHSSVARHGYNRGPSRWSPCPGVVWPGGQKQLVPIIDGRYCLDDLPAAA